MSPTAVNGGLSSSDQTNNIPVGVNLVVVSQRLPVQFKRNELTSTLEIGEPLDDSSLINTLAPFVAKNNGYSVGWPGLPINDGEKISSLSGKEDRLRPVRGVSQSDFNLYERCCRETLFPLLHSRQDKAVFEEKTWTACKKVSEHYAMAAMETVHLLQDEDPHSSPVVWLLDFHLLFVAEELRRLATKNGLSLKIGLFCFAPFPTWDVVRVFPWVDEMLQGFLSCDMICFHHDTSARHYLTSCSKSLGCRVDINKGLVEFSLRTSHVRSLPLGVDLAKLERVALSSSLSSSNGVLLPCENGLQIIFSIDRADYTQGIRHSLRGFERLLEQFPEHLGNIKLVQVCISSGDEETEVEIERMTKEINQKFSTEDWEPIRLIKGPVNQLQRTTFYHQSTVGIFTPLLSDGSSSLYAKEFIANKADLNGVLILSPSGLDEATSPNWLLREALIANPFSEKEMAEVLHRGLVMQGPEREARMVALRTRVHNHDLNWWTDHFLSLTLNTNLVPFPLESPSDFDQYLPHFIGNRRPICLLLDYDGTLTKTNVAVMGVEMREALERVASNPEVFVIVASGRMPEDVGTRVGMNDRISFIGTHGLKIHFRDGTDFVCPVPQRDVDCNDDFKATIERECCFDGAYLEDKGLAHTFHFKMVEDEERRNWIVERGKQIILEKGYRLNCAKGNMDCLPNVDWNKGDACIHILRKYFGDDWAVKIPILAVGDDVTDEKAFSRLKGIALSFRIVSNKMTKTVAEKRLASSNSMLEMLRWLDGYLKKNEKRKNI